MKFRIERLISPLKWLAKTLKAKLGAKRYLFLIAAVIGLLDGLAAVCLKSSVHGAEETVRRFAGETGSGFLLALFPVVGIGLSVFWVRFFIKDDISHGIGGVLGVISTPGEKMKPHHMFSSLVGCTLTAGFGGSVGMEGPIVATGSAIGDNVASLSNADYKRRMILIGCGAAGAISAIFKAPIAGLVFCVEVFALDVASSSVIALLISTAVACLFSMAVSGYQIEFRFTVHDHFHPENIPFYLVLGIVMAFVSVYFMRVSRAVESSLKKIRFVPFRVLSGGILIGLMILLFPALYGEGYLAMRSMLTDRMGDLFAQSFLANLGGDRWLLPLLLIALALVKPVATAVTTGSGGIGGTFAPTLFVGCAFGYAFAALCNFTGIANLPPMNFALAGMAGALSGIMAAPLTGVFLIAELTGGYELFIPLIVVSSVSTMIARHFEPFSIYTRGLGKSGRLITHHRDRAALTLLRTKDLIDTDFSCLDSDSDLSVLSSLIVSHPSSCYPVKDQSGEYLGFVCSREILPVISDPELRHNMILEDLIHDSRARLDVSMDAMSFFDAFEQSDEDELPVFENGKLAGIVTRKKLYAAYRAKVAELSDGNEP
jgi:CIC family chloride channel protein